MPYLLLILVLIFSPLEVKAKDLYLDTLEITNGELSLPFDKYNNKYTVLLAKDITTLDIVYEVDPEVNIEILDNHDLQNDSIVTINLKENNNVVSYELHILKDEEETSSVFLESNNDTESNFMYKYKIFIIPLVCFSLIVILFKIMFLGKKKRN